MNDTPDDFFATLLRDMSTLIEVRKSEMSPEELDRAISSIATIANTCGQAAAICHRMNYTDAQTQEFMRAVLQGLVEATQPALGDQTVH